MGRDEEILEEIGNAVLSDVVTGNPTLSEETLRYCTSLIYDFFEYYKEERAKCITGSG